MSSLTWSPTSYQLQFNFKLRKSSLFFVRSRISSVGYGGRRRLRVLCAKSENSGTGSTTQLEESSSEGNSRAGLSNSSEGNDGLNDWFSNSEQSGDSQSKGLQGLVGIGLASFFLVAGITFAGISIGKRKNSRPRPETQPLPEQQEMLLTPEEEVYKEGETKTDGESNVQDERNLQNDQDKESKIGIESELVLLSESTGNVSQDTPNDSLDLESLSEHEISTLEATDVSIPEYLQSDSLSGDVETPDTVSTSSEFPQLETIPDSYVTAGFIDSENTLIESESKAEDVVFVKSDNADNLDTVEEPDTLKTAVELSSSTYLPVAIDIEGPDGLANSKFDANLETQNVPTIDIEKAASISHQEDSELLSEDNEDASYESNISGEIFESQSPAYALPRGIPAPTLLSAALQASPGKILVGAVTDQIQGQALSALQVLKVIESDAQPGELCTRREYARWLVSASSSLSRNSISKVYPAMYIENITELAFDDVTPNDPDFISIQGLAEAGLISSKLSKRDMLSSPEEDIGSFYFHPDSPLSRQDLVTWKMVLEKRQLPEADKKTLHQLSGFIDIDKIDPDAWPALVADLTAGDQGIVPLAFGYTRLFQADKPVTKGQAAIALSTGNAADIVSEELARMEAESIADKAVSAHNALVAEVEKDVNANFEKELSMEREKIETVQKLAEEACKEVERLREEREEQNTALMKERAVIESQMEVLAKLRRELEEQLQSLMGNKVEISFEKERIEKLRRETEEENQAISRLQYELQVERKALSMARTWAEEEAKRVQEHAKSLEEARLGWERRGLKVMVNEDLREEETTPANTWVNVGKELPVKETVNRAETLTDKLKVMAGQVGGKSKEIINTVIEKIQLLISAMKKWISDTGKQTVEAKDVAIAKVGGSLQELKQHASDIGSVAKEQADRVVKKVSGN